MKWFEGRRLVAGTPGRADALRGTRQVYVIAVLLVALILLPLRLRAGEAEDPQARAEAASARGLKWLAAHQITEGPDAGSWEAPEPSYRVAVTSFAGLAFLANGHLPGAGDEYGPVVQRAMGYVQRQMAPDGYLGQGNNSGMYLHAIATLFGLSYLGLTHDAPHELELAAWCRKSLQVIATAQQVHRPDLATGGWRYTPTSSESDLSVTSWQMLVLHAARQCGYPVEDESSDAALRFINSALVEQPQAAGGPRAGFLYRPGVSQEPEPGVSGAALFIKCLYERHDDARMGKVLGFLASYPPTWGGAQYNGYFFFNAFYLTQGMFQLGEPAWTRYSTPLRALLVEHQAGDGSWPFPADDTPQGRQAGPAYTTAMAVLILALDKQYLPMYQRQQRLY